MFSKIFKFSSCMCGLLSLLFLLNSCAIFRDAFKFALELGTEIPPIQAGEIEKIQIKRQGDWLKPDELIFASENPQIATVDQDGYVCGVSQGETVIHAQLKENADRKLEIPIKVYYRITDACEPEHIGSSGAITSFSSLPSWISEEYNERVGNWDIVDIVKIVASKEQDEYIFSDIKRLQGGKNYNLILFSDWGNRDVSFDVSALDHFDFVEYVTKQASIDANSISKIGIEQALESIREDLSVPMERMQGSVALSTLPEEYEYRVAIKVNYSIYEMSNFYSKGILKGGLSVLYDLFKLDINSFLSSYSYSRKGYEFVLENYEFVIERRPK